jgi:hypothetical protein
MDSLDDLKPIVTEARCPLDRLRGPLAKIQELSSEISQSGGCLEGGYGSYRTSYGFTVSGVPLVVVAAVQKTGQLRPVPGSDDPEHPGR